MLYACVTSLVLGFATFDTLSGFVVMWLHSMPMRFCLDVNTWDVSPWCQLLHAYLSPFLLRAMICLPCLFVPPVGFLWIFYCCLCVHAWVLLASVLSILQHNKAMDIQSKPTFVPRGHHLCLPFCLFACLLVFLLAFLLVCLSLFVVSPSHAMLAISIFLVCFYPLCIIHASISCHCLSTGFLSLSLHVHTWSEDA